MTAFFRQLTPQFQIGKLRLQFQISNLKSQII